MLLEEISKTQENRVRRKAARHSYRVAKSRCHFAHMDNLGEFMLIDNNRNAIVLGQRYDSTLDEIEDWLDQPEA